MIVLRFLAGVSTIRICNGGLIISALIDKYGWVQRRFFRFYGQVLSNGLCCRVVGNILLVIYGVDGVVMNKAKPIEELIQAYQQGFLSEQDYNARLAQLSDVSDDEMGANSTLLDESGQLIKQALKQELAMTDEEKIDALKEAHAEGFLSDGDFLQRLAVLQGNIKVKQEGAMVRWLVGLFISALKKCASEQDRLDVLAGLALAREILANKELSPLDKYLHIYALMDFKKTVVAIFASVSQAVKNYATSDMPLALKVTMPVTLAAAALIGGNSVGIAGFGGAIGVPVLLLLFVGVAGVTAIIEAFLGKNASADSYIGVVLSLIAKDEVLRRTKKELREAMEAEPAAPQKQMLSKDEVLLKRELLAMNPYDFERHVMAFFQDQGLLAWVTKKSNDAGVDGFARHANGLIVVQCKRNAEDNPVGSPTVQQFKGVVEENAAWCGYIVTTSYFTKAAVESAQKNDKLKLVDMAELLSWHKK